MERKVQDPIFSQLFQMRPSKGDLKKFEIIKAAIETISAKGIEHTTLDNIGHALKINRSHVLYHYPDRDKMMEDVVKYITATAQSITIERLKTATNSKERLLAVVDGAIDWMLNVPSQANVMLSFYHLTTHNSHFLDLHRSIRKSGEERIAALIKEFKPSKVSRARDFQSCITGALLDWLTTMPSESSKDFRLRLKALVMNVLR